MSVMSVTKQMKVEATGIFVIFQQHNNKMVSETRIFMILLNQTRTTRRVTGIW
jgi:hypothetical protein